MYLLIILIYACSLLDLLQLRRAEDVGAAGVVVEEPVAALQPLELVADEAAEGGAEDGARHRGLADPAHEQVHIVHMGVEQRQPLHYLNQEIP